MYCICDFKNLYILIVVFAFGSSQDSDTSFNSGEAFFDYDQGIRYKPEPPPRKQEYQFKTSDITNVNQELRNGTADYSNRKLPVSVYIYGGKFLQITNLQNKDAWSTLPFNDENLRQIGILFNAKSLDVISSTLRAGSIPTSITKLNISQTRIIDGSLPEVLKRCDQLEDLILNRSGDLHLSDLPAQNLQFLETRALSLIYTNNVKLEKMSHIRFQTETFVDPRILRDFERIFPNLQSIGLEQTLYGLLKRNLLRISSLNWINIWNLDFPLLKDELEWDGLLLQNQHLSKNKNSSTDTIHTLVKEGSWKYFHYP